MGYEHSIHRIYDIRENTPVDNLNVTRHIIRERCGHG